MAGPPGSVTVPEGTDVRELVKDWDQMPKPRAEKATLRVRAGAGHNLRRYADSIEPDGAGWDMVTTGFPEADWYPDYLATFGPDVVVLDPPDLREAVIKHLKGVLT
jgi:proteasome accessory factor B